jgi:glycosyltransferase involved in cell wall biosynthesis
MGLTLPVDVIVPTYNGAAYLRESLGSIAAQTCGVGEVIVVDDGSTDDSAALARSLGARVVSQRNAGVGAARNAGIRASRAPFVALLDADDRWHPELLEAQWRVHLARPDVAIIATDYARWTGGALTGSVLSEHPSFSRAQRDRVSSEAYVVSQEAMVAALAVRNFVLPSSLLLDRRLFDEDGVYYRSRAELPETEDTLVGEDYEWLMRALRFTSVAFVDRVLVDYRQWPGTLSARRGRIRNGDIALGRMIAADPSQYAAGAAEAFARARPLAQRDVTIRYLKSGEFVRAAASLRELLRRPRPR